jgi:ubiquinone/menaquinone biosynthesis C-methylase UbiE
VPYAPDQKQSESSRKPRSANSSTRCDDSRGPGPLARRYYKLQHQGLAASTRVGYQFIHTLLNPGADRPSLRAVADLARRFDQLLERDLDNAAQGYYPARLLYDFPLAEYLGRVPAVVLDLPRIAWRSYRGNYTDLPEHVQKDRYPKYYLRNFHWQTDGWFSDRSAALYDAGVEFLFGGTADVMRRMALPPIVRSLRESGAAHPRVLDVGCGTGRFLLQLAAAVPSARLYGLDLSPYYLDRARELVGKNTDLSLASENAEDMPWAEGTFDAVTSVFMFHELPPKVRRAVVREMARVVKPGGVVVLCDSAQLTDSPELKDVLQAFPQSYHEPYYRGYLRDDLGSLLEAEGLELCDSEPHLVSKVVAARRPTRRAVLRSL